MSSELYMVAPDGDDEPTLWAWPEGGSPDRPVALLRECDLPPQARHLWACLVGAVTSPTREVCRHGKPVGLGLPARRECQVCDWCPTCNGAHEGVSDTPKLDS